MNAKEAIDKIAKLLNLEFGKTESFATTMLTDGSTEITNNLDEEFKIGQELFVVNESTLSPASEGQHTTREGLVITVDSSSIIIAMEQEASEAPANEEGESEVEVESEMKDMEMSEATLTDGTKIMSEGEKFEVGQQLYMITEEGEKVTAKEGEHTTESGIVITVDAEGIITGVKYPDESGEGSLEDFSALVNVLEPLIDEVKKLSAELSQMKEKNHADLSALKADFESFKKSPEKFSVVEKKTFKESVDDYKLEIIKSLRNK